MQDFLCESAADILQFCFLFEAVKFISCLEKKMLQGVSLLSLKVLAKMLGFSLYASVSNHSASV